MRTLEMAQLLRAKSLAFSGAMSSCTTVEERAAMMRAAMLTQAASSVLNWGPLFTDDEADQLLDLVLALSTAVTSRLKKAS